MSAELGNITPVLVVPGPYTEKELAFQAESVAGGVAYNASFNCNSPKMLVTPMGWNSRQRLLTAIERALGATPVRRAYYPGAEERWQRLTSARSHLRKIGVVAPGELPWTLVTRSDRGWSGINHSLLTHSLANDWKKLHAPAGCWRPNCSPISLKSPLARFVISWARRLD